MIHTILNFVRNGAASSITPAELDEARKGLKPITGLSKSADNLNISEQVRTAMIFNAVSASAGTKIKVGSDSHDATKKKVKEEQHREDSNRQKFETGSQKQQNSAFAKKQDTTGATYPGKKGSVIDILV